MRITYLHQYFTTPEEVGGTRSYEMGRRLVEAGHDVSIISSAFEGDRFWPKWQVSEVAGMTVHRVSVPYSNTMGYLRRTYAFVVFAVCATLRTMRVPTDVVFATSTPLTIAIPGRLAAAWHRVPYVLEVRDLWPTVPIALGALKDPVSKGLAHGLERWAYRGARRIVALAPGMKRHVVEVGYPEDRITLIPNGSDVEFFGDDRAARQLRETHEWLGERKMLVYAGALGLVNGVGWLVEVASHVKAIDPELRFVIVGGGREFELVKTRAAELGVLDCNVYMLGLRSKLETASWVRTANVASSLIVDREYLWVNAVTNKFFDALAAERPILSNHPGYQTEIALEAGAGAMLDAHDYEHAAQQLVALLHDDAWLRRASEASAKLARERFDRNILAKELESLLTQAVNDRTAKR